MKGEAFVPYYTGQVLDSIVVKQDFDNFKDNAKHFILAHFLSGMLGGVRTCMFTVGVSRLNVRLRKMVFKSLIEQDIGFFDKVKTGDMLSRLSADTTTMSDLISQNLNGFLWNLVKTGLCLKQKQEIKKKFLNFFNSSWNTGVHSDT